MLPRTTVNREEVHAWNTARAGQQKGNREGRRAHSGHGEYLREEACERQPAQRSRNIHKHVGQQHASPQHLFSSVNCTLLNFTLMS